MALPKCWLDLELCLSLKLSMESAAAVMDGTGGLVEKQKQLQELITVAELEIEPFECIFMDLDDVADESDLEPYAGVWQVEIATVAEDAAKQLEIISRLHSFQKAHVDVTVTYVEAKALEASHKQKIANFDDDSNAEGKALLEDGLAALNDAVQESLKAVHKAKRTKQLSDRMTTLSSPKRQPVAAGSSSVLSPSKRSWDGAGESSPDWSKVLRKFEGEEPSPTVATSSQSREASVSTIQEVIAQQLEDVEVYVKIFFVPHENSQPTSNFKNAATFDLFEARVGFEGGECALIAKGDVALQAFNLLQPLTGHAVRLVHTKYSEFKGEFQLELMTGFAVEACEMSQELFKGRSVKSHAIAKAVVLEDRSKVCLVPCIVTVTSESKNDKNGNSYRSTRIADVGGTVAAVMVWGTLADKDAVWEKNASIDIFAAAVNRQDKRFDLRNFSQVTLTKQEQSVRFPSRLTSVTWP